MNYALNFGIIIREEDCPDVEVDNRDGWGRGTLFGRCLALCWVGDNCQQRIFVVNFRRFEEKLQCGPLLETFYSGN
jgi:hypothetical protein